MKTENLPNLLLLIALVAILSVAASRTGADPDLWGHVRFGLDILDTRTLSAVDRYSFTSDRPWVNHEWLAEVLMASAYRLAGTAGLVLLKLLVAACTFGILWRTIRRAGVHPPAGVALSLVAALGVYPALISVRPQIFSVLLFSVLLALLNAASSGRSRSLSWTPLVFALWANLHGGWIVGAGVLGLWSATSWFSPTVAWGWRIATPVVSLLATLLTPYGFRLWAFLWSTVGLGRSDILDWQPLFTLPAHLLPWLLCVIVGVIAWKRSARRVVVPFITVVVLGALALRVMRIESFFALATVIVLGRYFAGLGPRQLPLSHTPTRMELGLVGALMLAGCLAAGAAAAVSVRCVTLTSSALMPLWAPEPEAVVFLRANALRGRLLTWFDYGEYAIWYLAPDLKVSYDGRRETVYSDAVQRAHHAFYYSSIDASYARRLRADYVWLPKWLPVIAPLQRDGWVPIFRGPTSVVLARAPGSYRQPASFAGPRCFPGP